MRFFLDMANLYEIREGKHPLADRALGRFAGEWEKARATPGNRGTRRMRRAR